MVSSPLSLERCSAFPWRGSGRFASPRAVSPRNSWIEPPTATRDEQVLSPRTSLHSILAIHTPRQHLSVLPGSPLVDERMGEDTGDTAVRCFPPPTEPTRRVKTGDIVSTRRSERDPHGVPMGGLGG